MKLWSTILSPFKLFNLLIRLALLLFFIAVQVQIAFSQKAYWDNSNELVAFGHEKYEGVRKVKALIIHSTFNASYPSTAKPDTFDVQGVLKQFKTYNVAAHFLIDRKGVIHQLVLPNNIAWHAGKSQLPDGTTSVNACSIGIEIMCTYTSGPNTAQYAALRELIDALDKNYSFTYILGHSDIAPGRKTDPWKFVDNHYFRK
ncbi:MAG: hypothetical protein RIR06_1088 [Bacteroidota bacterium]